MSHRSDHRTLAREIVHMDDSINGPRLSRSGAGQLKPLRSPSLGGDTKEAGIGLFGVGGQTYNQQSRSINCPARGSLQFLRLTEPGGQLSFDVTVFGLPSAVVDLAPGAAASWSSP